MKNELTEDQIKDLIKDTFENLKDSTEQDSKKLEHLNNALNWILTFTTVFFVFFTRLSIDTKPLLITWPLFIFKIVFLLMTGTLIVHKLLYTKYEDLKGSYLRTLHSH